MKVAIISGSRTSQPMGLESAERRLLDALRSKAGDPAVELRVVGGRGGWRYAQSVGARWYPARPQRMPRRAWQSADLIHLLGLDVPPPPRGSFIVTIHDLAGLHFVDEAPIPVWTPDIVARAARILTVSRFTASELQEHLGVPPERIRVVQNGPGQPASSATEPLSEGELGALGLGTPFVLRMGGYTQRKNVPVLLDAWPEIRRRTGAWLALAGPAHAARGVQLAAAPSLDGVVPLDYLPSAVVPRLLRAASVLVSTSTYEGFGLPPLEAMAAGTPVVAVRSATAEEVCGEAALMVEDDAGALSGALVRVLEDEALRARLIDAGLRRASSFSWPKAAAALRSVYIELGRAAA